MDRRILDSGHCLAAPVRSSIGRKLLALAAALSVAGVSSDVFARPQSKETSRSALRDVEFVDARTGWAVGDRGTILRTIDGGQTWLECGTAMPLSPTQSRPDPGMQRVLDKVRAVAGTTEQAVQQTILKNANCRLNSVSFVDAAHGWAVGGNVLPGIDASRGTILITDNGGVSWNPIPNNGLPHLYRMSMENVGRGWALGRSGHLHRGGYYETEASGRSWSSVSSKNETGDFVDGDRTPGGYVAVDAAGQLYRIQNSKTDPAVVLDRNARPIRRVRMVDAQTGWAVGDGGTVLTTADGGQSWRAAALPDEVQNFLSQFDLYSLEVSPGKIRFAGSPGTHVFSFDTANSRLVSVPTGTSATLYDMEFADNLNGWCVGANETILRTTDGGNLWNLQRGGAANLAVLAIALDNNDAGWEMLGRYSGDERMAIEVAQVLLKPAKNSTTGGMAEAAERLGAMDCRTVAAWTVVPRDTPDMEHVQRRLVSIIRQTRPQIVTCNRASIQMPDGSVLDTHSFLDAAIRTAATDDGVQRNEMNGVAGPWQCLRLATVDPFTSGDCAIDSGTWLAGAGQTLADRAMISRALAGMETASPSRQAYRVKRYNQARSGSTSDGLFEGLGTGADRRFLQQNGNQNSSSLADINRSMQKDVELARLAGFQCATQMDLVVWHNQVASWVMQTNEELAGVWLVQLSATAMRQGNLQPAFESLNFLVNSYPRHPLAPAAALWVARYVASEETRVACDESIRPWANSSPIEKLLKNQTPVATSEPTVVKDENGVEHMIWVPTAPGTARLMGDDEGYAVRQISAISEADIAPDSVVSSKQHWQSVAGRLGSLSASFPELNSSVDMTLAQANTVRKSSGWEAAKGLYQQLIEMRLTQPQAGYLALRERKISENPPEEWESRWPVSTASERPNLDGKLDDALWSEMFARGDFKMVSMQPPGSGQSARTDYLLIAADEKFVYVAGRCNRISRQAKVGQAGARVRDALTDNIDRVILGFDLDRDGAWPLWLGVAADGRIADGCGASRAWNPQWFVATDLSNESAWTFELAIAWDQLGQNGLPVSKEPMGIGLERFAPGSRVNLWDCPGPSISEQKFSLTTPSAGVQGYTLLQFGAAK